MLRRPPTGQATLWRTAWILDLQRVGQERLQPFIRSGSTSRSSTAASRSRRGPPARTAHRLARIVLNHGTPTLFQRRSNAMKFKLSALVYGVLAGLSLVTSAAVHADDSLSNVLAK